MEGKRILLMGAGRSSSALIRYLIEHSAIQKWEITVGDVSEQLAIEKTKGVPNTRAIAFDVNNDQQREAEISYTDLVISLLPPSLHIKAVLDCVRLKKSIITASYNSAEIQQFHLEAKNAGILILNECGLDPGIDHMSAMQIIHKLNDIGAVIEHFKSYTGGLIAPESNDNPWGYKFTWNPRNVILAGQGTARYKENSFYKYIPYNRLFLQTEPIEIPGHGFFEGYANRDSLAYMQIYGLDNIPTLLRGTLRNSGFGKAWSLLVKLGLTDDSFVMNGSSEMTYADMVRSFLPDRANGMDLFRNLCDFAGLEENDPVMQKIKWTGLLEETQIGLPDSTPAQILQHLLEQKWKLKPGDKDMIVMQHSFVYKLDQKTACLNSSLVVKGDDSVYTAMAKTVGLPLGMVAKLILTNKLSLTGVNLPVMKEVYQPVLEELTTCGITFTESKF